MKHLWPKERWTRLSVLCVVTVLLTTYLCTRAYTPQFRDTANDVSPISVASLEEVKIGGINQWILIRGERRTNPVLLFLPGGPGLSLMPLVHEFQRDLEKDFVVVQWDQRGAGKSHNFLEEPDLDEEQFVSDAYDLINLLRLRFHQPKIYVVGHSWGTYLGMRIVERYPDLIQAYIGVGQVSDESNVVAIQEQFVREQAGTAEDRQIASQKGGPDRELLHELVTRFGGDLYGMSSAWPLVRAGLKSHEYSIVDHVRLVAGLFYYLHHMNPALRSSGCRVIKVNVPVYIFAGRHDYITPAPLVEAYFKELEAPTKRMVWFDKSAHWPFFEEPGKFEEEMRNIRDEIEQRPVESEIDSVVQTSSTGGALLRFRCSAGDLEAYVDTGAHPAPKEPGDYLADIDVMLDGATPDRQVWSESDSYRNAVFVPNARLFIGLLEHHRRLTLAYTPEDGTTNETLSFDLTGLEERFTKLSMNCR